VVLGFSSLAGVEGSGIPKWHAIYSKDGRCHGELLLALTLKLTGMYV
jgi:hypothetical protein